jgi:hypothetical protein
MSQKAIKAENTDGISACLAVISMFSQADGFHSLMIADR